MFSWMIFLINIYIYSLQIFDLEACLIFKNKMATTEFLRQSSRSFAHSEDFSHHKKVGSLYV